MPSTKKRVNLTIPDNIYEQLQKYKEENGLANDATACLQLVVKQLKAEENGKAVMKLLNDLSTDQLVQQSTEGLVALKEAIAKQNGK